MNLNVEHQKYIIKYHRLDKNLIVHGEFHAAY